MVVWDFDSIIGWDKIISVASRPVGLIIVKRLRSTDCNVRSQDVKTLLPWDECPIPCLVSHWNILKTGYDHNYSALNANSVSGGISEAYVGRPVRSARVRPTTQAAAVIHTNPSFFDGAICLVRGATTKCDCVVSTLFLHCHWSRVQSSLCPCLYFLTYRLCWWRCCPMAGDNGVFSSWQMELLNINRYLKSIRGWVFDLRFWKLVVCPITWRFRWCLLTRFGYSITYSIRWHPNSYIICLDWRIASDNHIWIMFVKSYLNWVVVGLAGAQLGAAQTYTSCNPLKS